MKTKIVLWGENEKDEKILMGIELVEKLNLIRIHTVPEKEATEAFYNQLMNQWRQGQELNWPESSHTLDRPLSMTEGLLPDTIKTDRQDILARAKTEWHFVILSSKLYEAYSDEVSEIRERVESLKDFDNAVWEEMKGFWKKVQTQVQEKNLFREHASELRSKTDEIFDSLKSLKKSMNDEFEKASRASKDEFFDKLKDIDDRIEQGLGLQPLFNELRALQSQFRDIKFTRKHHNDVWKKLDGAFKKIKEKRFGDSTAAGNNAVSRTSRRYDGLLTAIGKMEKSIERDHKDKGFQEKRINRTDGQLELQIRQAKMAMIDERIASKQLKLDDMLKTKAQLEKKIAKEKEKAEKREQQKAHAAAVKEAKEAVKQDIAHEIQSTSDTLASDQDKLLKAAEEIKGSKAAKKTTEIPVVAAATNLDKTAVEAPVAPAEDMPSPTSSAEQSEKTEEVTSVEAPTPQDTIESEKIDTEAAQEIKEHITNTEEE